MGGREGVSEGLGEKGWEEGEDDGRSKAKMHVIGVCEVRGLNNRHTGTQWLLTSDDGVCWHCW